MAMLASLPRVPGTNHSPPVCRSPWELLGKPVSERRHVRAGRRCPQL